MGHTVCLIEGDGIGPEVTRATRRVIDATGVAIEWLSLQAGAGALETHGSALPDETVEAIRSHGVGLKGPLATPIGHGFTSCNVQLRKRLNLYAAIRPVRNLDGIPTRYQDVDLVVIRENTEGLYSGLENEVVPGVIQSLKICTRVACERIARFAFRYAVERDRHKVTVFHKANIMKMADGLFLDCARRVYEEMDPNVEYEETIIDAGCMQIVRDPTRFDVLLMENFYADVVSDLCAGLVGGLGVVPGANIGDGCGLFEAVHGTAPDIAGQGIANPLALLMSGVMMLRYLGEGTAADRIKAAYDSLLAEGHPDELTADIGGRANTQQMTDALIRRLG